MFDVEESPIPTRRREQVPGVLYPPTVLNEYIKCVAIGDSGVGKTCLITAWACNTHYTLDQLVKTHVSTVWAHDHYRIDNDILERSVVAIDGGYVALRLWDTFGYHDKDRGFAYKGADVILLCYSVAMPRSLNNLRKIWIPEIRRRAPATPVVVVGCQADLRYLYRDEHYQKIHKGLMYKVVQEKDIITPEQGRAVAKEIGAPYYECSVYTKYGIEDVFLNIVRAAMVEKRKIRFWSSFLRRIQYPQIQAPMKLPPLLLPKIEVPDETLQDDLSNLLHHQAVGDVVFVVRGQCFRAHKICLAVGAIVFENLFLGNDIIVTENANRALKRSLSTHGNTNKIIRSNDGNTRRSSDTVGPDLHNIGQDYSILKHSAFLTVEENKACENPFKPGEITYQTVVTVRNEITPRAFQYILEFLYTGTVKEDYESFDEVMVACSLLELTDLALMVSNVRGSEEYLNMEVEKQFQEYRKSKLRCLALNAEKLTDVRFLVDDGAIRAHKPLLMGRCEMMYAMFNDNFMESSADSIVLPGISRDVFLAIREFLYTGECSSSATLNCLGIIEAANRFCLPRLVGLVEAQVVQDLTDADKNGEDIIEDVLRLLEPVQLHNADKLSDWCVKYLCNHYLVIRQKYLKLFHKLTPENIRFIEKNKWPPEWYMKELNYFDHMQALSLKSKKSKRNIQQKQQFSRWDQCTSAAGCLCFCRRSRMVIEEKDFSESPFDSIET
ncbi:Rho-related BTB domain-containing protein 1 [Mactra antiquata]